MDDPGRVLPKNNQPVRLREFIAQAMGPGLGILAFGDLVSEHFVLATEIRRTQVDAVLEFGILARKRFLVLLRLRYCWRTGWSD
ncbi:hypothetical protein ACD578_30190 (plasmid) [Microvirga sp. RSM25]|uniref:hypothetical protein n=1 Tax=Microvirga sp. RSM25 TaxID=3273802 RepID=UPI00384F1C8E